MEVQIENMHINTCEQQSKIICVSDPFDHPLKRKVLLENLYRNMKT